MMNWMVPLIAATWRPFRDPLPWDAHYFLFLLPLVVVIAVVYKTIKTEDLSKIPQTAAVLAVQIVVFMTLAATVLWIITEIL